MKKLVVIIFVCAAIVSCKKATLPDLPEETGPYYSITGQVDGDTIDLNVGQEGIVIDHGVSSINGMKTYYGQLISPSDDLLIRIEFVRPEKENISTGFKAFDKDNLGFLVHESGCVNLGFGSSATQGNYLLIKNDEGDFELTNEISFDEFGIYEIAMKFTDVSQNALIVPIKYGYKDVLINSDFELSADGTIVNFTPLISEGTHQWFVDGDLVSTDESFSDDFSTGIHVIKHVIKDEYLNESSHSTLMRITDFVLDWQMGISYCAGSNSHNYGKVKVMVETNGETYRSEHAAQNNNNLFDVTNEAYFVEFGTNRAVFDFAFNSLLINDTQTDSLSLQSMKGTFNIGL